MGLRRDSAPEIHPLTRWDGIAVGTIITMIVPWHTTVIIAAIVAFTVFIASTNRARQ